jgi:hypothetical protein
MFLGGGVVGGKLEAVDQKMIPPWRSCLVHHSCLKKDRARGRGRDGESTEARRRSRRGEESNSGASMPT